jgi:hypothetical protein
MLTMTQEQLFKNIEILPIDMKTKIVDMLLNSLNPINQSIDSLWVKEVEKRKKDIELGVVDTVDGSEVFSKIKQRFHQP